MSTYRFCEITCVASSARVGQKTPSIVIMRLMSQFVTKSLARAYKGPELRGILSSEFHLLFLLFHPKFRRTVTKMKLPLAKGRLYFFHSLTLSLFLITVIIATTSGRNFGFGNLRINFGGLGRRSGGFYGYNNYGGASW